MNKAEEIKCEISAIKEKIKEICLSHNIVIYDFVALDITDYILDMKQKWANEIFAMLEKEKK